MNHSTITPKNGITSALPSISPLKSKFWELSNKLSTAASQLEALLCVGSSDEFCSYSNEIQINYLWACHTLSKDISDLLVTQWETYKELSPTDSQTPANAVIDDFQRAAKCFCNDEQAELLGLLVKHKLNSDKKSLSFIAEVFPRVEVIAKQFLAEISEPSTTKADSKRQGGAA